MDINTQDDWWYGARMTIPRLPAYAAEFNLTFDLGKARRCMVEEDHRTLHTMFEQCWAALPDSPIIRRQPFFDLADLCSEYWVFADEEPGHD